VPWETEAQIKLLWRNEAAILDFIWARALGSRAAPAATTTAAAATDQSRGKSVADSCGWKLFFSRVVLVPPNRFRPSAKIGEAMSEHPQNIHLSRIIEGNEKIRKIQIESAQGQGQGQGKLTPSSGLAAVSPSAAELTASASGGASSSSADSISKLVTAWIDLQNSVNCYVDSDKDPNPLGSNGAPSGIRQLLERKEGLFRKHMMGKRVNYCCRSVISPDPYLGTNEIGIPVAFAKTLHYPTPVNDWNVRYLRTLVERGPDQYPGNDLHLMLLRTINHYM
jgi:DNA-directed RNA polymerase I subunit RPA1